MSTLAIALALASAVGCAAPETERTARDASALVIQAQGSFAVGGTVLNTPGIYNNNTPTAEGQTFHGDHLYAFYQIPQNAKALPIVMLHGAYQSARSWETTPDGREGFQTIFLAPRLPGLSRSISLAEAEPGNSTVALTIEPTPFDQLSSTSSASASGQRTSTTCSSIASRRRWISSFRLGARPTRALTMPASSRMPCRGCSQDRPGNPVHALAGGRSWLADGDQEPQRQSDCRLRTGSGFIFPEGELPAAMPSAGRHPVARGGATRGL
jgi:hypothetical protein